MLISDHIAKFLEQMLDSSGGTLEIKRNDLAEKLGCVPSQINYVITSRFTPERGYVIESKRGGGGYIRIVRKSMHRDEYLMHFFSAAGEELDEQEASAFINNLYDKDIISEREAVLLMSTMSASALSVIPREMRNSVRADIMRHIILALMS